MLGVHKKNVKLFILLSSNAMRKYIDSSVDTHMLHLRTTFFFLFHFYKEIECLYYHGIEARDIVMTLTSHQPMADEKRQDVEQKGRIRYETK